MKTFTRFVLGCTFLLSCNKSENLKLGSINDLSPYAKQFIGMNSSGPIQTMSASGMTNSLMNLSVNNMSTGTTTQTDTTSADTTVLWSPGGNCASTIQISNPDGSYTYVTDYGEGCSATFNDCTTTYFGKSVYSYKNTSEKTGSIFNSTFTYSSSSVNFGSQSFCYNDSSNWVMNGNSSSSGQWQYDTASYNYSGNFTSQDSTEYSYNKTTYMYQGFGKSSYNNKKSVIESQDYSYRNGSDYYEIKVLAPIVRVFDCQNYSYRGGGVLISMPIMSIPVSGREFIKYSQNGTSGEFEIDYGDGSCDSLITIIEDGKIIIIDLNNQWNTGIW